MTKNTEALKLEEKMKIQYEKPIELLESMGFEYEYSDSLNTLHYRYSEPPVTKINKNKYLAGQTFSFMGKTYTRDEDSPDTITTQKSDIIIFYRQDWMGSLLNGEYTTFQAFKKSLYDSDGRASTGFLKIYLRNKKLDYYLKE